MVRLIIDLETELKQLEQNDTADIFNTIDSQREYLGQWLPFVELTKDISVTKKFVDSAINKPEETFEYTFTIWRNNEFIGIIGFKDTDRQNQKTEIGYWLSEKYQRQGIITKSVAKLCDYAFNDKGINRVQIKCAVGNERSKRIPQRLGFVLEGVERAGELLTGNMFTNLEVYSMLGKDWSSLRTEGKNPQL